MFNIIQFHHNVCYQFELGPFYSSSITIRDIRRTTKRSGNAPVIPICTVLHSRKLAMHHEMVWMVATDLIPELKTKKAVTVCDDEFQELMKKMMPASHHAACEVCTCSLFFNITNTLLFRTMSCKR